MHAVNPTRVAAVTGGLPPTIPADTVAGKNCGSGVTALYYASLRIRSGDVDTALVIGMEAMSRIPVAYDRDSRRPAPAIRQARTLVKRAMTDSDAPSSICSILKAIHLVSDWSWVSPIRCATSLWDRRRKILPKIPSWASRVRSKTAFSIRSHKLAAQAWKGGLLAEEVVPMYVSGEKRLCRAG